MAEFLLDVLNARSAVNTLSKSALIVIDAQREYLDGKIPLTNIGSALEEIQKLLKRARTNGSKIYFIRHSAGEDSPIFNPKSESFQIIQELQPQADELIIDKNYPNSFAKTTLAQELKKSGINNLIISGFMTHACISTTVRSAAEQGYQNTLVAGACATRDLPGTGGGTVAAEQVHNATIAALQDLFATVVASADEIPD